MTKKIFFGFSAGMGPFIRCVPIMQKLRTLGYELAYNAIDNVTEKMALLDFKLIDVPWVSGQNVDLLPPLTSYWYDAGDYWGALGYKDPEKQFQPDLIVGDFSIEAQITARLLDVPFISITQSCYHPQVRNGRLRWWEDVPSDKPSPVAEINSVLSKLELDTIQQVEELFIGDITVIPSFETFDVLETCPSHTHYVGPILWDGFFSDYPTTIEPTDEPTIFVYTGRLQDFVGDSGTFILEQALTHFISSNMNIVISVGSLDSLPDNLPDTEKIKLVEWIPISEAYQNTSLVMHHGGHGSCMATFKYGTPSLVIPTHSEREYNARALDNLGAGKMLQPSDVTAHTLIATTEELLAQEIYRKNAQKWQNHLGQGNYGGAEQVLQYITQLL